MNINKEKIKKELIEFFKSIMLFLMFCSPVIVIIYYEEYQEKIAEEQKIKYIDRLEEIKEKRKKESCKISLEGVNTKKAYRYNKDLEDIDIYRCDYLNKLKEEKDIEEIENIKDEINRYIYEQYKTIIKLEEEYPYIEFRKEKKELNEYLIK